MISATRWLNKRNEILERLNNGEYDDNPKKKESLIYKYFIYFDKDLNMYC